jgi:hypothetical protein
MVLLLEWSTIHALDISPVAIDLLRQDKRFLQFNQMAKNLYHSSSLSTSSLSPSSTTHTAMGSIGATYPDVLEDTTTDTTATTTTSIPLARAMVCDISKPVEVLMLLLSPGGKNDDDENHQGGCKQDDDYDSDSDVLPPACQGVAHVTTLLFCLSAIAPPLDMQQACCNVASTLRPGGVLVVQDYGRYDQAQLKLARSNKNNCFGGGGSGGIGDDPDQQPLPVLCVSTPDYNKHWYRKHDGTCCYYFTTEDLIQLFHVHAGLIVLECRYIHLVYRNQATGELQGRIWVQGRFQKPKTNKA